MRILKIINCTKYDVDCYIVPMRLVILDILNIKFMDPVRFKRSLWVIFDNSSHEPDLSPPEYPTEHAQSGGHIPGAENIPWAVAIGGGFFTGVLVGYALTCETMFATLSSYLVLL